MENIPFNRKLTDTVTIAPSGRVETYWRGKILRSVFTAKRAAQENNTKFEFHTPNWLMEEFGLKGFEFGNWLTQEDRYIFLAGAAYGVKDYCKVLHIAAHKFGLGGRVSIALGARGQGGHAIAHFEPSTFAINITKYNNGGSLGHEYGHALDFYAGRLIDKTSNHNWLSERVKDVFTYSHEKNGLKLYKYNPLNTVTGNLILDSFGELLFKEDETGNYYTETDFYRELKIYVEKQPGLGKYYTSIIEIFARSYEVFLFKKCEAHNIQESFLKKKKYAGPLYPAPEVFTPKITDVFTKLSHYIIEHANAKK